MRFTRTELVTVEVDLASTPVSQWPKPALDTAKLLLSDPVTLARIMDDLMPRSLLAAMVEKRARNLRAFDQL